ncbi:MAG: hypothetical protein ABI876_07350 [Bacteroidota bacterium]
MMAAFEMAIKKMSLEEFETWFDTFSSIDDIKTYLREEIVRRSTGPKGDTACPPGFNRQKLYVWRQRERNLNKPGYADQKLAQAWAQWEAAEKVRKYDEAVAAGMIAPDPSTSSPALSPTVKPVRSTAKSTETRRSKVK